MLELTGGRRAYRGTIYLRPQPRNLARLTVEVETQAPQAAAAGQEKARRAEALDQSQGLKIKGMEKISTGLRYLPYRAGGEAMRLAAAAPATPIEGGRRRSRPASRWFSNWRHNPRGSRSFAAAALQPLWIEL